MKKLICILLIISTIVLLCACGSGSATNDTPQGQPSASDVQNEIPSEAPEEKQEYQSVNFGDTISLDFAEITIDEFGSGDGIVEEEGNSTSSFNKGHYMAYLKGTIKNLYSTYIDPKPSNSYVTMIFDDKYTYTGSIHAMTTSFDGVPALETCGFYVYAEVSEEVVNTFSTVKIIFGFTENFESPEVYSFEDFEKCDYIYQLEATK